MTNVFMGPSSTPFVVCLAHLVDSALKRLRASCPRYFLRFRTFAHQLIQCPGLQWVPTQPCLNWKLFDVQISQMPKLEIASNRFRHFSKPCKANRQGRLATNAPKLHDFGGGDTLWNPVHYFFVNFGDFWYISNAGCNAHFFLQLYFTIKLEVFDPISLVEGDFPAEKKTNTSRYLHLPCIIWKMWTAFLQAWWCLSVMSVHCHGRYIRMSWRLCCCCWQSWPSWDTSLQPCPTELFAAHWKLTIH